MVWGKFLRNQSIRPEFLRYYHYSNSNLSNSKTPIGDPSLQPPPKHVSVYTYQPDVKPEIFGKMIYMKRNQFELHNIYWFENFEYKYPLSNSPIFWRFLWAYNAFGSGFSCWADTMENGGQSGHSQSTLCGSHSLLPFSWFNFLRTYHVVG